MNKIRDKNYFQGKDAGKMEEFSGGFMEIWHKILIFDKLSGGAAERDLL